MKKADFLPTLLLPSLLLFAGPALGQDDEGWGDDDGYETGAEGAGPETGTAPRDTSGSETEPGPDQESFWNLRLGAKGGVTGNLWSAPEEKPPGLGDLDGFWGDDQFFVGGGGGLFVEANFFRFLGLELDLLFESNAFTFNYTINSFEYDYNTSFTQFRVPLLVKCVLPLGEVAEMSLGLGPEFVVGLGADAEVDFVTDVSNAPPQLVSDFTSSYQAEKAGGTFFDLDFGLTFKVWRLVIPFDIRAGINLNQPPEYDERVTLEYAPSLLTQARATVKAIESYNFAVLLGIGYLLSP